jgi:hypothetical protein
LKRFRGQIHYPEGDCGLARPLAHCRAFNGS